MKAFYPTLVPNMQKGRGIEVRCEEPNTMLASGDSRTVGPTRWTESRNNGKLLSTTSRVDLI